MRRNPFTCKSIGIFYRSVAKNYHSLKQLLSLSYLVINISLLIRKCFFGRRLKVHNCSGRTRVRPVKLNNSNKCCYPYSISVLASYYGLGFEYFAPDTSCLIKRLFRFGSAEGGIEKMRSIFFQRSESSAVETTKPCGLSIKDIAFERC